MKSDEKEKKMYETNLKMLESLIEMISNINPLIMNVNSNMHNNNEWEFASLKKFPIYRLEKSDGGMVLGCDGTKTANAS